MAAEDAKKTDEKIEALGISNGVGLNLPFSAPFWMENRRGKARLLPPPDTEPVLFPPTVG